MTSNRLYGQNAWTGEDADHFWQQRETYHINRHPETAKRLIECYCRENNRFELFKVQWEAFLQQYDLESAILYRRPRIERPYVLGEVPKLVICAQCGKLSGKKTSSYLPPVQAYTLGNAVHLPQRSVRGSLCRWRGSNTAKTIRRGDAYPKTIDIQCNFARRFSGYCQQTNPFLLTRAKTLVQDKISNDQDPAVKK